MPLDICQVLFISTVYSSYTTALNGGQTMFSGLFCLFTNKKYKTGFAEIGLTNIYLQRNKY